VEEELKELIEQATQRTTGLVKENEQNILKLTEELVEKESLELTDIRRILGERKFPIPRSIQEYYDELEKKKIFQKEKLQQQENDRINEEIKQEELERKELKVKTFI
jgi:hypothetical protein